MPRARLLSDHVWHMAGAQAKQAEEDDLRETEQRLADYERRRQADDELFMQVRIW